MQPIEMAYKIGRCEIMASSAHNRLDDHKGVLMILLRERKHNGNGTGKRKIQWLQFAAMGTVALSSLIGLLSPEKAVALLRALAH